MHDRTQKACPQWRRTLERRENLFIIEICYRVGWIPFSKTERLDQRFQLGGCNGRVYIACISDRGFDSVSHKAGEGLFARVETSAGAVVVEGGVGVYGMLKGLRRRRRMELSLAGLLCCGSDFLRTLELVDWVGLVDWVDRVDRMDWVGFGDMGSWEDRVGIGGGDCDWRGEVNMS